MSLHDDLNNSLAAWHTSPHLLKYQLDEQGHCAITVPIPPTLMSLRDNQLTIEVKLSPTGQCFTLTTPLAIIDGQLSQAVLAALVVRQFYADQVEGGSFGLAVINDNDVLVAQYHWILDSITPPQFTQLFQKFMIIAFTLIGQIRDIATRETNIHLVH